MFVSLITKLFRFYVLSSSHVALALLSLLILTHRFYDLSWQAPLFVFVFCATVTTYNFIRYYAFLKVKSSFKTPLIAFSSTVALGLGFSALKLPSQTLFFALVLGLVSLAYALPKNRFFGGLRQLPYMKSFIVAGSWASVVVLLPLISHQIEFDRLSWLLWFQMALWTFATMIPFEIRDTNNDSESMKTIPQVFGIRGAKLVGTLALIGVVFLSYSLSIQNGDMIPTVIATILVFVCLWKSTIQQSTYFASFWVEALPMVWLFLVVVWEWI